MTYSCALPIPETQSASQDDALPTGDHYLHEDPVPQIQLGQDYNGASQFLPFALGHLFPVG